MQPAGQTLGPCLGAGEFAGTDVAFGAGLLGTVTAKNTKKLRGKFEASGFCNWDVFALQRQDGAGEAAQASSGPASLSSVWICEVGAQKCIAVPAFPQPLPLLLLHGAAPSAQRLELKHVAAGRRSLLLPRPFYWEEVGGSEQILDSASKCHCTSLPSLRASAPRCCAVLALCVACSVLALIRGLFVRQREFCHAHKALNSGGFSV